VPIFLEKPSGIIPALSTLCNDEGELDTESERSLVRTSIEWGCAGVAVSIIAGEFYKFTDYERKKTFDIVIDAANGKIPVWAGISHLGTASSIELAKYAEDAGADGVIAQPALVGKDASLGLHEHFQKIFSSVDIPIMIQDAEDFNGIKMEPGLYTKLANEFENFVSVKIEGGKTLDKIRETKTTLGKRLSILGGMGGRLLLEELELGTVGSIPNPCMTDIVVRAYNLFLAGDMEGAKKAFSTYKPWLEFQSLHSQSAFEIVKETLRLRGIVSSSFTRSPHLPMTNEAKTRLSEILSSMGYLKI
jgi:4-hydroxy-tetrahydrodipicolinate synthase